MSSVRTKKTRPPDFTTRRSCSLFRLEVLDQRQQALAQLAGPMAVPLVAGVIEALLQPVGPNGLSR